MHLNTERLISAWPLFTKAGSKWVGPKEFEVPNKKAVFFLRGVPQIFWPFLFWYGFRVLCISHIFFPQWICSIWLFELKLMIVLLSAPSSPVQNRRLLSARNARMSSIEMPDDNEKSVSSASTSPCHSPVNTFAKYVTVFLLWFS